MGAGIITVADLRRVAMPSGDGELSLLVESTWTFDR